MQMKLLHKECPHKLGTLVALSESQFSPNLRHLRKQVRSLAAQVTAVQTGLYFCLQSYMLTRLLFYKLEVLFKYTQISD